MCKVRFKKDQAALLLDVTHRITCLLNKEHKIVAVYENMFGAGKRIKKMVGMIKKGR